MNDIDLSDLGAISASDANGIASMQNQSQQGKSMTSDISDLGAIDIGSIKKEQMQRPNASNADIKKQHPYLYKASEFIAKSPTLSKLVGGAGDISEKYINRPVESAGIPEMAGGFLQGGYSAAKSIADIPSYLLEKTTGVKAYAPKLDLSKYISSNPMDRLAFMSGKVGGETAGVGGAYAATEAIPGMAIKSIPRLMSRGAIAGAATSEDVTGGRVLGGTVGALAGPLGGISTKASAENILKSKNALKEAYNNLYQPLFKEIKEAGIDSITPPKNLNITDLRAMTKGSKALKEVERFYQNPTIETAQDAQSTLFKVANKAKSSKNFDEGSAFSQEYRAYKQAMDARKKIMGSGYSELVKQGRPDLAQKYAQISQGYAKDVVPYNNKAIGLYERGKISAKELSQRLSNDHEFMTKVGNKNHPELKTQSAKRKAAKYGAAGATTAGAIEIAKALGLGSLANKYETYAGGQ